MKSPGAGEISRDNLFSRIKWLMFFRAVVVTLLLGATVMVQLRDSSFFRYVSPVYFYAFIGFTYTLTLVYALLLRRVQSLKLFAYVQILGDVFFITLLIYLTGGISSIFSWVYLLAIFSAGTDGSDGPTEDAGALVDGGTIRRGELSGLDAAEHLRRADSGVFLEASGDLISTGPTGTNVRDLVIAWKG